MYLSCKNIILQMLKHVQISPLRNRSDSLSIRSTTSCASSLCGSPEPPSEQLRATSRASSYCSLNDAVPQVIILLFSLVFSILFLSSRAYIQHLNAKKLFPFYFVFKTQSFLVGFFFSSDFIHKTKLFFLHCELLWFGCNTTTGVLFFVWKKVDLNRRPVIKLTYVSRYHII